MSNPFRILAIAILSIALLLAADLALYAARLASMPAPVTLQMPVPGVKRGALADTWQAPRAPRRRHQGIDIFAARGAAVVSTTEGIVFSRGQDALGGNVVWVYGPGGQRHYYAHLERFAQAASGDRIRAGTLLGYVGNSGNARTTPAHLHYGVYGDAGAINPYPLLATAGASHSSCSRLPAFSLH